MSTHNPWGPQRPCWHCSHFDGLAYEGSAALCHLTHGPRVRSSPANGCSAWQREPGTDDEPDRVPAVLGRRVRVSIQAMPPDVPRVEWAP